MDDRIPSSGAVDDVGCLSPRAESRAGHIRREYHSGPLQLNFVDRRGLSGLLSDTIMIAAEIDTSRPLPRRRESVHALLPVFFLLAISPCAAFQHNGMPRPQRHENHHEIFQLEEEWRVAMLKADIPTLDAMMADDYIAITPNGTLQSKEQSLANLRSGATRFTAITIYDRKARFYGSTALVTSRADVSGMGAGSDYTGSYRYTRVYVRNAQGLWKIVSFEASRIRFPGAHE
jgi:ketosteroid isomerase-like protein